MNSLFINIPIAIYNSICFLAIGYLVYLFISKFINKASNLFGIATSIQLIATCLFLMDSLGIHTLNFIEKLPLSYFSSILSIVNHPGIFNTLSFIYILAVIALSAKMVIQIKHINALKNNCDFNNPINLNIESYLNLKHKLNIKIGTHKKISAPIVYGILEHIIILPSAYCNNISPKDLKLILLHEMAHIIRKDYLVNLFLTISNIILCFNPFVYLFKHIISLQREMACDAYVINNGGELLNYSKLLLNIASSSLGLNNKLSLSVIGEKNELLTRIKRINGKNDKQFSASSYLFGLLMLSMILILGNKFNTYGILDKSIIVKTLNTVKLQDNAKSHLSNVSLKHNKSHKMHVKILQANNNNDNMLLPAINNNMNRDISYSEILDQTKKWIKSHEQQAQFINFSETQDSIENEIANKLLILSIIKSYQIKKAILEARIEKIYDLNEANDFLLNSKEWNDLMQYEQWAHEILKRSN
jgi:beta-lactamase regulating signal transducer with metallopeptidase domain